MNSPRYRIERSLGHGGLGEVFLAWDMVLRRRVALKRQSSTGGDGAAQYEAAWHEAVHLASIQHPNVVTVYDFGTDAQGPFLIMELVGGETLDKVVARGVFPVEDFRALAGQTLQGLSAAHQADLLHGDLKPGNIMLKYGPTGMLQVKILDFGTALDSTERAASARAAPPDQPETILGTVEFMPPERFEREPVDARGELYSLGCIFYYALTGLDPFRGATQAEIIARHLAGQPTGIGELRQDLTPPLCAWIMRLLSRKPQERPASAQGALEELQALGAG